MKSSAIFTLNPQALRRLRNATRDTAAEDCHASAEGYFLKCLILQPRKAT